MGKQSNLKFDICLYLQNNDELWFYIEDLHFCMFPFDKVKARFCLIAKGFISGNYRILKLYQGSFSAPYRWYLQQYDSDECENIIRGGRFFKIILKLFFSD